MRFLHSDYWEHEPTPACVSSGNISPAHLQCFCSSSACADQSLAKDWEKPFSYLQFYLSSSPSLVFCPDSSGPLDLPNSQLCLHHSGRPGGRTLCSVSSLLQCGFGNSLQTVNWGNDKTYFLCSPSLRDPCPVLPVTQCLKTTVSYILIT